jgi:hypothetical protein
MILLDPPYNRMSFQSHTFVSGDKVSGKVVFNLMKDEDVAQVFVEFYGKYRTKMKARESQDYQHYELVMFREHELLFKGPYKMRASTYEYPFTFQFPETFKYINEFREDTFWSGGRRKGPRPLPLTCWRELSWWL